MYCCICLNMKKRKNEKIFPTYKNHCWNSDYTAGFMAELQESGLEHLAEGIVSGEASLGCGVFGRYACDAVSFGLEVADTSQAQTDRFHGPAFPFERHFPVH